MKILVLFLLIPSVSLAESKVDMYFKQCRQSSLAVILNITKDAKEQYRAIDEFSLKKCSELRDIKTKFNTWEKVKKPTFDGCVDGVDVALGMSSKEYELRKKFKKELCF